MSALRVECHAGYRGEESPRRFRFEGRTVEIADVLARWREPQAVFFRVRSVGGGVYVLRRQEPTGEWGMPEVAR
jgi:hypothetical protein